jgi:hypothetical protein
VNTCRQNYRASIPGGGNIYSIKRIVNWRLANTITGFQSPVDEEFLESNVY